ncbi:MAG: hypothetical protein NVSMB52_00550 [Chloroflexota bacterium]
MVLCRHMQQPPALFVYGTLKRGQSNHGLLTPFIRAVEPAWTRGLLYDLGDFPALVEGEGKAWGDVVRVDHTDLPRLLPVLDRLEGYNAEDEASSMYIRRTVAVFTQSRTREQAYAYFYNPHHPALLPLSSLHHLESGEWSHPWMAPERTEHEGLESYREWVRTFRTRNSAPE